MPFSDSVWCMFLRFGFLAVWFHLFWDNDQTVLAWYHCDQWPMIVLVGMLDYTPTRQAKCQSDAWYDRKWREISYAYEQNELPQHHLQEIPFYWGDCTSKLAPNQVQASCHVFLQEEEKTSTKSKTMICSWQCCWGFQRPPWSGFGTDI